MRYLAIDLGARRTGVAAGDDATRIVTPLEVIDAADPGTRDRRLLQLIEEHGPGALVVGLPLDNRPGQKQPEGPAARLARAFAGHIQKLAGLPVRLADERLSSFAADVQMQQSGLTRGRKKQRRDALAAAAILRDFLAARGRDADKKERGD